MRQRKTKDVLLESRIRSSVVWLALFIILSSGCATQADTVPAVASVAKAKDYQPQWEPLFKGIELAEARKVAPDPLAVYAVRIDLKEPSIEFLATPSNGDRPLETDGRKTTTFLKEFRCQIAINASPFSPVEEGEGNPKDILGLSASRGDVYSGPHGSHCALLITKDNKVSFAKPPIDTHGVYNAVAGFDMLLERGRNVGKNDERHPRTAAGMSKDHRYLYFLLIDGRQPSYSVGTTTKETAEWIRRLGAYDALNLDGGGSTTLVISDDQGGARILNRPIHNKAPGTERVNGNHLGVYAKPLKD
jgi:hypothetical protein